MTDLATGTRLLETATMLVFLTISLFMTVLTFFYAPIRSAKWLATVHVECLKACPSSVHAALMNAVVCGEHVTSLPIHADFAKAGVAHLLIVSSAQVFCIEALASQISTRIRRTNLETALVFGSLIALSICSGFGIAFVRAIWLWFLRTIVRAYLGWSRLQCVTLAGFLTLPLCRSSTDLFSLSLGWTAGLAYLACAPWRLQLHRACLQWRRESRSRRFGNVKERTDVVEILSSAFMKLGDAIIVSAVVYVMIMPALVPLGLPSLLSIVSHGLLLPVLSPFLFPLSALSYVSKWFLPISDFAWTWTIKFVSFTSEMMPDAWDPLRFSPVLLLFYIAALTVWLMPSKRRRWLSSSFILVLATSGSYAKADELIVWNIGQGSWATLKTEGRCQHFDMGGEWMPRAPIHKACGTSTNEVYFSHWDWDHVGFTPMALRLLPNLCMQSAPKGRPPSESKAHLIDVLPVCKTPLAAHEIFLSHLSRKQRGNLRGANELSQVFTERGILFPGDSPQKEEKLWSRSNEAASTRILIAGHHGSKTATSLSLLKSLTRLKVIVVSARLARYGHPHAAMLARAKKFQIPVLRTEDWGSLHFELDRLAPRR